MTNNDIKNALYTILSNAALGYPIAWQGTKFTPPATGLWLETAYAPNQPLDNSLEYTSGSLPRGIWQVAVCGRPTPNGTFPLDAVADQIAAKFKKGTTVYQTVRITKVPRTIPVDTQDSHMMMLVSCEFSG